MRDSPFTYNQILKNEANNIFSNLTSILLLHRVEIQRRLHGFANHYKNSQRLVHYYEIYKFHLL